MSVTTFIFEMNIALEFVRTLELKFDLTEFSFNYIASYVYDLREKLFDFIWTEMYLDDAIDEMHLHVHIRPFNGNAKGKMNYGK